LGRTVEELWLLAFKSLVGTEANFSRRAQRPTMIRARIFVPLVNRLVVFDRLKVFRPTVSFLGVETPPVCSAFIKETSRRKRLPASPRPR
jgi:hypothetical protein